MMLINGIEATHINATDRGLAYGDGLFSTIKVEYGVVLLWDLHLQRLKLGVQRLSFSKVDWSKLSLEVNQLASYFSKHAEYVLKVIITRGSGGRGYSIQGCHSPLRIISSAPFPSFYAQWKIQGIDIVLCESQLSSNKQLAGLKTLNRLEQVLIKQELEKKQAVEGIVCDGNGFVIEACSANVFIYLDDVWQTPKLDKSGVAGIQRSNIMKQAKVSGINIVENYIHKDQLVNVKAICLTNALMGVMPVSKYQGRALNLGHCQELQLLIDIRE